MSQEFSALTKRGVALHTHQIVAVLTRTDQGVVSHDEQNQEGGQHVKLPVPHCHDKHLQTDRRTDRQMEQRSAQIVTLRYFL